MTKGFVFAVASNGVCSFVSVRTGKVLRGSAVKACERSVLASVRVKACGRWGLWSSFLRRGVVNRVLSWRRQNFAPVVVASVVPESVRVLVHQARRIHASYIVSDSWNASHIHGSVSRSLKVYAGFVRELVNRDERLALSWLNGCRLARADYLAGGVEFKGKYWRRLRVRRRRGNGGGNGGGIRNLDLAKLGLVRVHSAQELVAVVGRGRTENKLPASCGSALLLDRPEFLALVKGGECPVKLSMSAYRWPVRSSVLLCVLQALDSQRVRDVIKYNPAWRRLLERFTMASLRSLGFRGFKVERNAINQAALMMAHHMEGLHEIKIPIIKISERALWSAFTALSRCLNWLCTPAAGNRGCPPSLRPVLSALTLSSLSIIAYGVLPSSK